MMMNALESRLEEALERHAAQAGPVAFTADEIFRVGRRARARRRGVAISASAAAVAAIAVVAVAVLPSSAPNPVGPASPSVSPAPTSPASTSPASTSPASTSPASTAPVDYALGATIYPASGAPVTVALLTGDTITHGQRASGGWVVQAEHVVDAQPSEELWWQPDSGAAVHLGRVWGGWQVSADGSVLVFSGEPQGTVFAYRLPSGDLFEKTTAFAEVGPVVLGVTDDEVLLKEASGDPSPTPAGVWRPGTYPRLTSEVVHVWGMSGTGQVLVGFTDGCITVVAADDLPDAQSGGVCGQFDDAPYVTGDMSTDGQALLSDGTTTYLVRGDDLTAGVWNPIASATGVFDFAGSTIYRNPLDGTLDRCESLTSCTPLGLLDGAVPLIGVA